MKKTRADVAVEGQQWKVGRTPWAIKVGGPKFSVDMSWEESKAFFETLDFLLSDPPDERIQEWIINVQPWFGRSMHLSPQCGDSGRLYSKRRYMLRFTRSADIIVYLFLDRADLEGMWEAFDAWIPVAVYDGDLSADWLQYVKDMEAILQRRHRPV